MPPQASHHTLKCVPLFIEPLVFVEGSSNWYLETPKLWGKQFLSLFFVIWPMYPNDLIHGNLFAVNLV